MPQTIALTVNGVARTVATERERSLLEVLREDLELRGTKYGCGEGRCGACTVLVEGRSTHACVTPVGDVGGKAVETIESLATEERLHLVQEAFLAEGAYQCGYCTPGMILTVVGLLNERPVPTAAEMVGRMEGQICRCCGYPKIVKAIERAAAVVGRRLR